MNKTRARIFVLQFFLIINGCSSDENTDWTSWRGPNRDGTVHADNFNPRFPENPGNLLWSGNFGTGYASITVSGNRLYTAGRIIDSGIKQDILWCLDAETGGIIWERDLSFNQSGSAFDPRSQPVLSDGILYYISPDAVVTAFKARNGKILWSRDLQNLCKAVPPQFGIAGSPVILDDFLILNVCGSGAVLNRKTGKILWSAPGEINGYSTPVVFNYQGEPTAVLTGLRGLHFVRVSDGELLKYVPLSSSIQFLAPDPVVIDEDVVFVSFFGTGSCLIDCREGNFNTVWDSGVMDSHFSSPLYYDNFVYGIDGSTYIRNRCYLKCIDPYTGEELWSEKLRCYGSLILINNTLVLLEENGRLMTIKAQPNGYEMIAERRIFKGSGIAWVAPVFSKNRLYLKSNTGDIICLKTEEGYNE